MALSKKIKLVKTDEEKQAIRRKFDHPEDVIICPRCGNELDYKVVGQFEQSTSVECRTMGCIHSARRGL